MRNVLVTGAGSGIGRASAVMLAKAGYRLALIDLDSDRLAETERQCGTDGVRSFVCDVSDAAAVTGTFEAIAANRGSPEILVNSAGIARYASFLDLANDDWVEQFAVNLMGSVHSIRAALPNMLERRSGLIINIGSRRGLEPKAVTSAYSASKAGLLALSQALNQEFSSKGIAIAYLAPGGTQTNLASPKDDRFMKAESVAEAVLFMAEMYPRALVRELVILPVGL